MRYTKKGDPNFLENLIKFIKNSPSIDDDLVKGILRDIESENMNEGRVSKAFSTPERI